MEEPLTQTQDECKQGGRHGARTLAPDPFPRKMESMSLRSVYLLVAFLVALVVPAQALAWGFDGHRRLAANAHEPFPANSCLRLWLEQVTDVYSWTDKSCDPDRWRNTDQNEWPRHFLNIDWADPIQSYPREWADVEVRFGQYAVKNGTVPWRTEEFYGRLVNDMKAGNSTAALDTVAFLSHYVTDAFSPMHDTKNQAGDVHTRYESQMLNTKANIDAITTSMRQHYGTLGKADPRHHLFDIILVGHPLSVELIAQDTQAQGDMAALYQNSREMTARRWADSLTLLASLVGTAWVEAGKPMLSGMPQGCSTDVAQGELVLEGYALPPPYVPDAGTPAIDSGTPVSPSDGGTWPDGGDVVTFPEAPPPVGCEGCGGGSTAALIPLLLLGLVFPARSRKK